MASSEDVGRFLRAERNRRGVSQMKVAYESGVSINTLRSLENGHARMDSLLNVIGVFWDGLADFGDDFEDWHEQQE